MLALAGESPPTSVDIGQVAAAGSTSTANGVYTVRASGADIWGTQDEFRFVHAQLSGDGEITARVDSLTATDPWTKAGVMIRETLNANSRYAYTLVSAGNGVSFQHRLLAGDSAVQPVTQDQVSRAPYWVRLRRTGNVFTAYVSANGQAWRQQGNSVTIAMGATVYAGLAVTSHLDGSLATAAFSNMSLSAGGTTPPPANRPPTITGTPPSDGAGRRRICIHADRRGSGRQSSDIRHRESAELGDVQHDHGSTLGNADERQRRELRQHRHHGQRRSGVGAVAGVRDHREQHGSGEPRAGDLGHAPNVRDAGHGVLVSTHRERSRRQYVDVLDREPSFVGDVQHDDGPVAGHADGEHVGTFSNIVISVSDGRRRRSCRRSRSW